MCGTRTHSRSSGDRDASFIYKVEHKIFSWDIRKARAISSASKGQGLEF